jgi:hypothetical protein
MRIAFGLALAAFALAWPSLASAQDDSSSPPADTAPAVLQPAVPPESAPSESAPSDASDSTPPAARPQRADFGDEVVSDDARSVADWVMRSDDNHGMPFIIIDKIRAKLFVFDPSGQLLGATLVLLGKAVGDDSAPNVGHEKLSAIPLEDQTTPAGRFMAAPAHDRNVPFFWVDYENAVSLHRVVGPPSEHRLERLATTSADDKRISHGCINVAVKFFDDVVLKTFSDKGGIVYILPEVKTVQEVFPGVVGLDVAQGQ